METNHIRCYTAANSQYLVPCAWLVSPFRFNVFNSMATPKSEKNTQMFSYHSPIYRNIFEKKKKKKKTKEEHEAVRVSSCCERFRSAPYVEIPTHLLLVHEQPAVEGLFWVRPMAVFVTLPRGSSGAVRKKNQQISCMYEHQALVYNTGTELC